MSFLDQAGPIAFAHRGWAQGGDENSMVAFERAIGLGYRYLETDIRVTADGVALAFHDSRLDRVTDRSGIIERLPWAVVRQARIAGREPIPTLTDVLAAWPRARLNLDVKSARGIGPTIDAIRATGARDRVCVAAFSTARIQAVRAALGPDLCTALGPARALALRGRLPDWRSSPRGAGRRPEVECLQVPARIGRRPFVDARFLAAAHARGLPVHAWTVNDRSEMESLLDLGVDGIMTDRADELRDVLRGRGYWPAVDAE